jgi:hypothetical protein
MTNGYIRGLVLGVIFLLLDLVYVWRRYAPDTTVAWKHHTSESLFLFALCVLIFGVVIFTRLFSFRRRMHLPKINPFDRFTTREEYEQHLLDQEKRNEEDEIRLQERGRDITLLVTAMFMIGVSILLTP